jgi:hypothetical protein
MRDRDEPYILLAFFDRRISMRIVDSGWLAKPAHDESVGKGKERDDAYRDGERGAATIEIALAGHH